MSKRVTCPYSIVSRVFMNGTAEAHNSNVRTQKEDVTTTLLSSENTSHKFLQLQDIPGPSPSLPFIGTRWQYFHGGRYHSTSFYESCKDKHRRFGSVVKEEFQWQKPVVHLSNPEDFETVHRFQGNHPIRPTSEFLKLYRESHPEKYDTVGLANSQGEEWERLRKVLAPILLQMDGFMDKVTADMNTMCDDFVDLLRGERDQDTFCISNTQDLIYKLALESIYMMSLDTRLGCLSRNLQPESQASLMILSVKLLFEAFQDLYYGLPLWKYFSTAAYKKLDKAESIMYDSTSMRIWEVMKQLRENREECDSPAYPGVLQTLISNGDLSDKEIIITVLDFISGGIFTVTNAFSFLLYHISRNPDVQERLYRELKEAMPDSVVTNNRLSNLRYLKSCVKESFRITPTIPTITRVLPEPIVASGYHIPAGVPLFCNFTVPCMESHRYPQPDRFMPDRWMRRNHTVYHTMLPFGFGRRMCIGRRVAENEMFTALAKLILNFKLESTGQEVKCKQAFIIVPSHPVSIIFKDRKNC